MANRRYRVWKVPDWTDFPWVIMKDDQPYAAAVERREAIRISRALNREEANGAAL